MTERNETENDRQSETLCHFFRHKLFKYIFMVSDDQRILEYLIVNVQVQLEQRGKKILKIQLSEEDHYAYRQVKDFLESQKESACDGLLVTGLNTLIYRHGAKVIELLNTSRDAFSRFRLPIAFVVNQEILKRIVKGAPDLYNMRDMPDLYFEGKWAPDMEVLASSFRDYSQHDLINIDLKIQLLEKQLKRTNVKGKIDDDVLNNTVIPLLILYLEQGNLKKMKYLYQRYIKGNEHRVKDRETLDRYKRKTYKRAKLIEMDNKYIEDRIESRRHFIRGGEWDKAAEITFALVEHLSLHGFPQRSMELLMELADKALTDKNRSIVFHHMGNLFEGFGNYDAALMQYQKSLEIAEKIGDIKVTATNLHQIGRIYQYKGDYEAALTWYQKSLEIKEKIGDIAGMAISLDQMGKLYVLKNTFETALNFFLRAFKIFNKIGSYDANQARESIFLCRKKIPEERFQAILKEFEIDPKVFDPEEDEVYYKLAMQFFSEIAAQAVATSKPETSAEELENTRSQLIQWIDDVKDDPHQEPVKNYFQFLLAYVNKEDYQILLPNIDPELKTIFENCLNHDT